MTPTQAKPEHTPYQVLQGQTVRGTPDAFTISHALDNGSEDVKAFIVRAVNAHDDMLSFLKFLQAGAEDRISIAEMPSDDELLIRLKAVIAKAEGLDRAGR